MLGSAITIGATMYPLFEQLDILDEFVALGKPSNVVHIFKEDLTPNIMLDWNERFAM